MLTVRTTIQPTQQALTPFIDIYNLHDKVIVLADMPGVPKDGVEIRVQNDQLAIHGYINRTRHLGQTRLIRQCPHCNYHRVLKLSAVIDVDKIEAQMEKGVLTLTLAKKQSDQPVAIPISVQ